MNRPRASTALLVLSAVILSVGIALSGAGATASADPSASDWLRLRQCESGNNYGINTGNGYYGAYQFDLDTWHSLGGTGLPNAASPATQDALALKLWKAHGWTPWACASIIGLISTAPPPPRGSLDSVTVSGAAALVRGWAFDPGSPARSIEADVSVNGVNYQFVADGSRSDVDRIFRVTGRHGYAARVPLREGANKVCVSAIGVANANNRTTLGCRTVQSVKPPPPVGHFDVATASGTTAAVGGWTFDRTWPATSIRVHIYVNGKGYSFAADKPRPDVDGRYGITGQHGFMESVPINGGLNTICAYGVGVSPNNNALISCRDVSGPVVPPSGHLDSVVASGMSARANGWAFDPNAPATSIDVHVYVNDVYVGRSKTTRSRSDVNRKFGITGVHGYSVPTTLRSGSNMVCVYAIGLTKDNNTLSGCTTVQGSGATAARRLAAARQGVDGSMPLPTPTLPASAAAPPIPPQPTATATPSPALVGSSTATAPAVSAAPAATAASSASTSPQAVNGPTQTSGPDSTIVTTPTQPTNARGALENVTPGPAGWTVTGWAYDPRTPTESLRMALSINGVTHGVVADRIRDDVNAARGLTGRHGLSVPVTLAPGANEVCLYELDARGAVATAPVTCTQAEVTG